MVGGIERKRYFFFACARGGGASGLGFDVSGARRGSVWGDADFREVFRKAGAFGHGLKGRCCVAGNTYCWHLGNLQCQFFVLLVKQGSQPCVKFLHLVGGLAYWFVFLRGLTGGEGVSVSGALLDGNRRDFEACFADGGFGVFDEAGGLGGNGV